LFALINMLDAAALTGIPEFDATPLTLLVDLEGVAAALNRFC
jgi:hypothetical protein